MFLVTVKAKILLKGIGSEDKVGEPGRRSMRLGDDFDWLGGYCANHEAPEVRGPGLMDAYHPLPQWGR